MKRKNVTIVRGMLALGFLAWVFGGGLDSQVKNNMQALQNNAADNFAKQYEMVQRNGSNLDKCNQSGLAAAAYLDAKDEANYRHWKIIQDQDCKRIGL